MDRMELGARIRGYREGRGLQQTELADKLGVDQATISRWETGRSPMGIDEVIAVAEALGIDVAELWKRTKRPPKPGNRRSG